MAKKKQDEKILYAFIASFFLIIGFIIALIVKKDDKYVMFYAKQGLVICIGWFILMVLTPILFFISPIAWVLLIILWVITWINSLSGIKKKTIVVGDLAEKIKI